MKSIGVRYVRAKNREINNGQDMVIQTDWMQLVGVVRYFSSDERGESLRREFLATKTDPHFFAKADGYRVYISLYGALSRIPQRDVMTYKEDIHEVLREMAQFSAENMTDGMCRHYADKQ